MSRRPRNNHYHYAEQYSDGHYRRKEKAASVLHMPRRAVFFAVLVLLVFGLVTTTFSANTSDENTGGGSILISVRNAKVNRDLVLTGASSDEDLADTGALVDYAPTAAQTYYYTGQGNSVGWGNQAALTVSSDGFYEYIQITSTTTHQFKIGTSSNAYAYNHKYVTAGFNSTNVSEIGDYDGDNCYCWKNATHYILVYYPNTVINTTNNPIICASTTLPDNHLIVKLGEFFTNSGSTTEHDMTESSGTWTYSQNLTGNLTRDIYFHVTYNNRNDLEKFYKDQNEATMTYDHCTNWQFETNNKGNPKLATVITGSYTFEFVFSTKKVSVMYPSYTVTTSVSTDQGTTTNTASPATQTVAIGSGVQVSATTTDSAYNFSKWTVSSGSAKSGSYASGTNIGSTGSTSNPLTIYPYGTSQTVNLRANYAIKQYPITYSMDASPATAASGTITNPSSPNNVPTGDTKQHGASYTITSNKFERIGYTQVGWSTSANRTNTSGSGYYAFGATYSTDSALTLYPVWQLNTPTKSDNANSAPQIVSTGSMAVNGTPVSLNLDAAGGSGSAYENNPDISRSYAYTITGPSGNNASVGTDPAVSSTFMKFTADIPGTYTVTITVTDVSDTGVTNPVNAQNKGYATANTNTATITVAPDAPQFDITFHGVVDDPERDGTTGHAYMVLLGNRYYFSAAVNSTYLTNHPTTDYTYEWAWDADFDPDHIIDTNGANLTSIDFIDAGTDIAPDYQLISYDPTYTYNNDPEDPAYDPDPRMITEESDGGISHSIKLYCRVTCNSVSNDSLLNQKFYFIQPLIKSFDYEPMQKIFNLNDQTVSLAAEYNVADNPNYTTQLFFNANNSNTPADWRQAAQDQGFIHSFANAIRAYLYPSGPKFFYLLMNGVNAQNEPIISRSEKIHTTVNTADSTASRTLYFKNTTNTTLKNYLVMCYYIDGSGNLRYQTAQDMNTNDDDAEDETTFDNNGYNYRVMLPGDAQAVRLGFLSTDNEGLHYYGTPTVTSGTIGGFSTPTYYGCSEQIALTASTGVITLNSSRDLGGGLIELYYNSGP